MNSRINRIYSIVKRDQVRGISQQVTLEVVARELQMIWELTQPRSV